MARLNRENAWRVLDAINIIPDETARGEFVRASIANPRPVVVSFVNAHAFNLAWRNRGFADDLCRADVLLRDGSGMSILLRMLDMGSGLNMNGTDLIPEIVRAFTGKRIALCGTVEPYLSKAAEAVELIGGTVILALDGFAPLQTYAPRIAAAAPDLVILGMGMPKQEQLAIELRDHLQMPVLIVCGGAILDFWAGRFPRAPLAWRRARMEWLFRLIQEPRRLWRRYLLGNAFFLLRAFRLKLDRSGGR